MGTGLRIMMLSNADVKAPYGQYTRPTHIADELARCGNTVVHFCRETEERSRGNVKIMPKALKGGGGFFRRISGAYRLMKAIKAFGPDVIYSHEPNNGLIAERLAGTMNLPWVFDSHGSITFEQENYGDDIAGAREIEARVLSRSMAVIVASTDLKDIYRRRFAVPSSKIHVALTGVDTSEFTPAEPSASVVKKLRKTEGDIVIHFTAPGSFHPNDMARKWLSKRIVPDLEKRLPGSRVIVTGGGSYVRVKGARVSDLGYVSDLADHVNAADICISPYPDDAVCGGVRNKVLDYFSCAKPVVSTTMGMMGINDAQPGIHFMKADGAKDFVDRLIALAGDKTLCTGLGRNARELAVSTYDWSIAGKKVDKVLRNVVRDWRKGVR